MQVICPTCQTFCYALIPDRIERRSQGQLVGWLRHPCYLRRDAEQAVVVVVHAVEIEPDDRLGKALKRRAGQELCAAEGLNAEAASPYPRARRLIHSAFVGHVIEVLTKRYGASFARC
jgi:hypothetical protein